MRLPGLRGRGAEPGRRRRLLHDVPRGDSDKVYSSPSTRRALRARGIAFVSPE
ncbi:hypothetical protein NKG05_04820 [Oerskovia sp. M15]